MITEICKSIGKVLAKERIKEKKQNELARKKCDALSLQDRYYYGQMIKDNRNTWFFWIITFPFYAAFYLGLFSLVMFLAFNINLKEGFILLLGMLFKLYPVWFMMFIAFELIELINEKRFKLKLLGIK